MLFDHHAAVWLSEDGSNWERAVDDPAVLGGEGDQVISAVAQLDGQLIAVGESVERAAPFAKSPRPIGPMG